MNKIDIVRTAFSFENPEEAASHIADNFQATDSVGGPPMDKTGWVKMGDLFRAAFPDIEYVIEDIREEGEGVRVVGRFAGTFTNDLDLSIMNLGVIPATGAPVDFPTSTSQVSFEGGKISRSHDTDTGPDAGVAGFLKALGVDMS